MYDVVESRMYLALPFRISRHGLHPNQPIVIAELGAAGQSVKGSMPPQPLSVLMRQACHLLRLALHVSHQAVNHSTWLHRGQEVSGLTHGLQGNVK